MIRVIFKTILAITILFNLATTANAACVNNHIPIGYVTWGYWLQTPKWVSYTYDGDAPTKHSGFFVEGSPSAVSVVKFDSDGPVELGRGTWMGHVRDFNSCNQPTGRTYRFQNVATVVR